MAVQASAGSWTLVSLAMLSLCHVISPQDTVSKNTCSFLDDNNVFKIEVVRANHDAPCPSTASINDQIKQTETKLSHTTYEVMQLQRKVLEALERNDDLTFQLLQLQQDLTATQAALPALDPVSKECPPGYQVRNNQVKSCYMFVGRPLNWYDAGIFCMSTRGHLIALESAEEQAFVVDYIKKSNVLPGNHMWTGGNDISSESLWMWAGINQPMNYTHWMDSGSEMTVPDNKDDREHCVQLYHLQEYAWNDEYCRETNYFICEYKLLL